MNQEKNNTKIVKMKDIIRLFFKFAIEYMPIIDKEKKLKGFLDKKLIIQDASDTVFIEKPFPKLIGKFIFSPSEEDFLQLVTAIPDELKFPVIDMKGAIQYLWLKKDLLNSFYNISKKTKSKTEKTDLDYKDIIDVLPFNFLVVDEKHKIINANKNFLSEFDFEQDILFNRTITKFFPKILLPHEKNALFPKIHSIKYRHTNWYYTIFQVHSCYMFAFSLSSTLFTNTQHPMATLPDIKDLRTQQPPHKKSPHTSLTDVMENNESKIIKNILEENDWNIAQAARVLNIPRQTLQYKISKYKII